MAYAIKVSVITAGILHIGIKILSFEGFVRNV